MRHRYANAKLNKRKSHQKAMLANMATSLITHEQIKTTLPKARLLRQFIEPLVTLSKKGGLNTRRRALALVRDGGAVQKLMEILAKRYENRQGGYTRILKAGNRYGDNAPMAYIEFVERDLGVKGAADKKRHEDMKQDMDARASGDAPSPQETPAERKGEKKEESEKKGLFTFMNWRKKDDEPPAQK